MSLAAAIAITDQDIYQQSSVIGSALIGQSASTPDGKLFAYAVSGGALTAGQITQPAAVTANYATRTLSTSFAAGSTSITVTLGTTAAQDLFKGFRLSVTDGTGKGQSWYVTSNTAATAGNSNSTIVGIDGAVMTALDNTSVVGIYPSQESNVVQHTAAVAIPTSGAPVINITSGYFFWNQIGGWANILSDAAITKNAGGIPSDTVPGAIEIEVAATVTQRVGYAPELTVDTKYSPFVLSCPVNG